MFQYFLEHNSTLICQFYLDLWLAKTGLRFCLVLGNSKEVGKFCLGDADTNEAEDCAIFGLSPISAVGSDPVILKSQ